jgi:hypothetical protein
MVEIRDSSKQIESLFGLDGRFSLVRRTHTRSTVVTERKALRPRPKFGPSGYVGRALRRPAVRGAGSTTVEVGSADDW